MRSSFHLIGEYLAKEESGIGFGDGCDGGGGGVTNKTIRNALNGNLIPSVRTLAIIFALNSSLACLGWSGIWANGIGIPRFENVIRTKEIGIMAIALLFIIDPSPITAAIETAKCSVIFGKSDYVGTKISIETELGLEGAIGDNEIV